VTTALLVVLRHAEAAHVPGVLDAERPLTERGERDARRAGRALGGLGVRPDLVLCSPATRTLRTARLALAALAPAAPLRSERDMYLAESEELLELIRRTDDDVRTLLLVGHNPGVHELACGLTGRPADPGFAPGAFSVIESDGEWAGLWPGGGREVARWSPDESAGDGPHEGSGRSPLGSNGPTA
jgi:phosphohistidine phosphatase